MENNYAIPDGVQTLVLRQIEQMQALKSQMAAHQSAIDDVLDTVRIMLDVPADYILPNLKTGFVEPPPVGKDKESE